MADARLRNLLWLAARGPGGAELRFRLARARETVAPRAGFSVRIAIG